MATRPTEPKRASGRKPRLDPYTWAKLDEEAESLREALEMLRWHPDQSPRFQYEKRTELRGLLQENDRQRKHLRGLAFEAHEKKRAADPIMATQPIDHKKGSVQKPRLDPYTWAKLDEEEERLRDALEMLRFDPDQSPKWQYEKGTELRGLLEENERQRKHLRGLAFEAEEKKRAAEAEKKRQAEKAAAEKKRAEEKAAAEKKCQAEKTAAEKKRAAEAEKNRAAEKAAAEQKRKEKLLKQKEEEKKALQAQLAAEQKRKAEAEAAVKRQKEERAAAEEKKRQELIKKADEELESLKAELAEKKRHADLLAGYERERAVEEARKKLKDAKRRLKLEYDEWQEKSYEAWKALDRERQRSEEEDLRRDARKEKEVSLARKKAEQQTSSAQRPKEVSFDSFRNQTYEHRPAPHDYRQPAQQNLKRLDNDNQQKSYHPSHGHSDAPNHHSRNTPHRQEPQPKDYSSRRAHPQLHQEITHPIIPDAIPLNHQAPVGLSGMPIGSPTYSYSPAVAPWEEKNQSRPYGYAAVPEPQWQSHHDMRNQKSSATEKKWSTPVISTWNGPALEPDVIDENRFASPVRTSQAESPKEKWPLPPLPTPNSKQVNVRPPRETEEEKLRRELAEYKVKAAKLEADLERKKRVTGADSVATWQTGTKSIWEDPTKDTSKPPHGHQSETPKAQAAKPSTSWRNEQDTRRDNKGTSFSKEPSKPTVSVQNLRRREQSVDRSGVRPSSRTSTHTRYFEAEEHISSDEEITPRPKLYKPDTHYGWQKSVEPIPSYVPPTPHRHQSPPPALHPTPPRGSRVSIPATLQPASNGKANFKEEIKTSKLTGIPGSWRDELPGKDPREDRWPANVSTPSVKSPPIAVYKVKEKFQPERYIPPNYGPKDVPPPDSYLSAGPQQQQPGYNPPVAPYYNAAAIPQPGPAYPIHHPLYAPQVPGSVGNENRFPPKVDVEAGPSGHGGSFSSWADPTAAQSLGGTQAPPRRDKRKGKARW